MNVRVPLRPVLLCGAAILVPFASPVAAQQAAGNAVGSATQPAPAPAPSAAAEEEVQRGADEIVVTAQRREQNLQEVGVSITAIGGEDLSRLAVSNATDIAAYVPNLRFTTLGGSVVQYNIRGVSQNGYADHLEPPVAIYLDDSYLSTSTQASLPVFDVRRVEVLRGPQGTLFGRNATGGLIHFISAQPTDEVEGYVDATLADDVWGKIEGAVSGPIAENAQARVAVAASTREGYIKNNTIDGGALGGEHYVAARGILAVQPSPELDVNLNLRFYKNFDQSGTPYTFAATVADADGLGRFVGPDENPYNTCNGCGPAFYEGYRQDDIYEGAFTSRGNFRRRAVGATLKFDYDLGTTNLISITDYQDLFKTFYEDVDAAPQFIADDFHEQKLEQATQEFQAVGASDGFRWTAGAYLFYQRTRSITAYNLFDGAVTPVERADMKTHSAAAYAQGEYDLSDYLTFILGGRYTYEKKKIDHFVTDEGQGLPPFAFNPSITPLADQKYNLYSAKAEVQWKPTDDLMLYASFNRGTKSGAFSLPTYLPINPLAIPFTDETLYAYEIGEKWSFGDGLGRLNSSLFYYDYKDYQAFNFRTLGDVPVGTIINSDATAKGAEVELLLNPTSNLSTNFSVTLLDTKVKNVQLPSGRIVDRDLPQSPSFAATALVRYETPIGGDKVGALQFDVAYTGKQSFTVLSAPNEREGDFTTGNIRLSVGPESGDWEAGIFVRNLWNEKYRIFAFDLSSIGTIAQSYARPRTIGATFRYNFR